MSKAKKHGERLGIYNLTLHITVAFVALIVVAIGFISLAFYRYNIEDLRQSTIENSYQVISDINYNIDSYVTNIKSMAKVVVDNRDVRQLISFYNKHKEGELSESEAQLFAQLQQRASAHMNIVANTRDEISSIAIVPQHGNPVFSNPDKKLNEHSNYQQKDWFLEPLKREAEDYISPSYVQNLIQGEYRWVISVSRVITDPQTDETIGVMLIDLIYGAIEEISQRSQPSKGGYSFIIDEQGNIITHPQQQLLYSGIKSEPMEKLVGISTKDTVRANGKLYVTAQSEVAGWSTVGVINEKEIPGNQWEITVFYLVVSIFTILFVVAITLIISTSIVAPIGNLKEDMDKVRKGDLTVRSNIKSKNEIGDLSDSFNIMIAQIQNLMDKTVATEKEKLNSEIKALQSQINPHFLYNTLDTIIWLSAAGKNEEVIDVTGALADLFRTSISQGKEFVQIPVEIENIENYLIIQKVRYKDKLNYTINITEEARQLYTPKLLLQPIVENAVYHGIKLSPKGGKVDIKVETDEKNLYYIVTDDGVGMDEDTMKNLFNKNSNTGQGIGILNVQNRIQLIFGSEYGLSYSMPENGGIKVVITIPAIKDGGDYTA